jgi:hypothetical protein
VPRVRLTKSDLPQIIANIENNGGDASELRSFLDTTDSPPADKLTDEDFIAEKRKEASVVTGSAKCPVCEEVTDKLLCGVCENCFAAWALTAKKE